MKKTLVFIVVVLGLASIVCAELLKNTAGQQIAIYVWDGKNGIPATGIGASLTVAISKDGGAFASLSDTEATETGYGWYVYDLSQSESNCDMFQAIGYHATDPNYICTPLYAYPKSGTTSGDITSIDGSSDAATALKTHMLARSSWYDSTNDLIKSNAQLVLGETPASTSDITTANATALSNIYLDQLMANALTDPNNVADNSVLAKLASATAAWATFNSASHSLEAIADSIIPPPGGVDLSDFIQDFVVASGSTPRSVVITVSAGDDAIPSNFWKDHMAVFYDATLSSDRGAQWRKIIGNTASSSGTVTLRLDKALDFTPEDTTDYVYIVGFDKVAEGYVR